MSRLNNSDYNKLGFLGAKLKAVYAVSDAVALGAKANEIITRSAFLLRAEHMPLNIFSDDTADDSDAE